MVKRNHQRILRFGLRSPGQELHSIANALNGKLHGVAKRLRVFLVDTRDVVVRVANHVLCKILHFEVRGLVKDGSFEFVVSHKTNLRLERVCENRSPIKVVHVFTEWQEKILMRSYRNLLFPELTQNARIHSRVGVQGSL